MSTGLNPVHKGAESGAAYENTDLHPRVVDSGRYAMPFRPYVYGMSSPGFQKRRITLLVEGGRPEVG